jgi:hypothetical protein
VTSAQIHIPILIIGATFTGIGIAAAARERSLIIEQGAQPGSEFISSYRQGVNWDYLPHTEAGNRLRQELIERNVLGDNGRVHIPAALPILCRYLESERLPVMLMTSVVSIIKRKDDFEVTLIHTSGLQTIIAEQIIDTTGRGWGKDTSLPATRKSLNAMLHNPESSSSLPQTFDSRMTVSIGRFVTGAILELELHPDDDWITARRKLHSLWSGRPESWRSWSIAAIADAFDYRTARGPVSMEKNRIRLPSCAYSNLLEAYEAGLDYIQGKGENDEAIAMGK